MKFQVVQNVKDIADITEDKNAPLVTRDGAKLITLSITGTNPTAAITGAFSSILNIMNSYENSSDKTFYMIPGSLTTGLSEHKFTVVIGITGVADLDEKMQALPKDLLGTRALPVENVASV